MLYEMLKDEFTRNVLTRLVALLAYPVLRAFKHRVDPRRFNGATLIGLKGVVVKSHGSADALAFQYALRKAYTEAAHGVLDKIAQRMATMAALTADARRGRSDGRRCIAASPGPAAICPRKSSPTTTSRSASIRAMRGSARARASASAGSPRRRRRRAILRSTPRARRSRPPASRRPTSISSSWRRPRRTWCSRRRRASCRRSSAPHGGPAFDVQAVCSGFVYALAVADRMVASGMATNALVVGAEIYSRILDWNDRGSCVLFGDGAGAVVLVPSPEPGHRLGASARRRPLPRHPVRSGDARRGRGQRHAVRADGRPRRVQIRGAASWPRSAPKRSPPTASRSAPSIGSFRTRRTSGSWKRPRRSWESRPSGWSPPSTGTPIRRPRRFRWRSTRRFATAGSRPAIALLLIGVGGGFAWGSVYLTW